MDALPALTGLLTAFGEAMAGRGDGAIAGALAGGSRGPRAGARLDVHRNNIASSLVRSLEGLYPALLRLMGADFFARAARDYVRAHPPPHGRLVEYGFGFPGFVAGYEAAGGYPWLADVARLELAWHRAYIAAEAPPLALPALGRVPPERMADLRLEPHPSCQWLTSRYPVSAVWRIALESEEEPDAPIEIDGGAERLLVIRPEAEVEVRTFAEPGFVFARRLAEGRRLGEAYETAQAVEPGFDLRTHLTGLLAGETFSGYRLEGGAP